MDFGSIVYLLVLALGITLSIGIVKAIKVSRRRPPKGDPTKGLRRVLFVSEFECRSCGRTFVVYEERDRIPYCQECGTPDPKHVSTQELREELRFKARKS